MRMAYAKWGFVNSYFRLKAQIKMLNMTLAFMKNFFIRD